MHPFFAHVHDLEKILRVTRSHGARELDLSESDWCLVSAQGRVGPYVALHVVDGDWFGHKSTFRLVPYQRAKLEP